MAEVRVAVDTWTATHRMAYYLLEPVRLQHISCEALYVPRGAENAPGEWLYCHDDLGHSGGHWAYRSPYDSYVPWKNEKDPDG